MLYILDTDHISLVQRQHPLVSRKLSYIPSNQRAVTAISLVEQLQGRLANIHRVKAEAEASMAFHYGAVIVTRNRRDFNQVPDLTIVDWSQP